MKREIMIIFRGLGFATVISTLAASAYGGIMFCIVILRSLTDPAFFWWRQLVGLPFGMVYGMFIHAATFLFGAALVGGFLLVLLCMVAFNRISKIAAVGMSNPVVIILLAGVSAVIAVAPYIYFSVTIERFETFFLIFLPNFLGIAFGFFSLLAAQQGAGADAAT